MASGGTSRSLQDTPTWALATVCFVFIFLSIFIEHLIHLLSQFFKRHRKTALFGAVEKLKSVLMLLGFMSLILTVTQRWISKICIPTETANTMLPCRKSASTKTTKALGFDRIWSTDAAFQVIQRRLADTEDTTTTSATTSYEDQCEAQGKTSFISQGGLNQLNNFIFVLAIMQIVYSVLTMALGRAKFFRLVDIFHRLIFSRTTIHKSQVIADQLFKGVAAAIEIHCHCAHIRTAVVFVLKPLSCLAADPVLSKSSLATAVILQVRREFQRRRREFQSTLSSHRVYPNTVTVTSHRFQSNV